MNIFTTIFTDSITLNKSMSSANSLARTDDLLATAEFQKDKRDLGAKLSMKGRNNIFKAEIKYSLIFGVKFQRFYRVASNSLSMPCCICFKSIFSLTFDYRIHIFRFTQTYSRAILKASKCSSLQS